MTIGTAALRVTNRCLLSYLMPLILLFMLAFLHLVSTISSTAILEDTSFADRRGLSSIGTARNQLPTTSGYASPSSGTDIVTDPSALILCFNQTQCIKPQLELRRTFNVYMCQPETTSKRSSTRILHSTDALLGESALGRNRRSRRSYRKTPSKRGTRGLPRFYNLVKEGLQLHPRVNLVDDITQADLLIYLPILADWKRTKCNELEHFQKMIILDEGDYPELHFGDSQFRWLLYFKRSYVQKKNGSFVGYMDYLNHGHVLPMTYMVLNRYVKPVYQPFELRSYTLMCSLRGVVDYDIRLRVKDWVEEYARVRSIPKEKYVAGQVDYGSRFDFSAGYFSYMYGSRIVITANPTNWEGDFRLCEALASGALVMVDKMYIPRPHPFIDGIHLIYYDNNNKTDLFGKLDYFSKRPKIAAKIALQGYLHAMKYHRSVNLIDYIFKTAHVRLSQSMSIEDLSPSFKALQAKVVVEDKGITSWYSQSGYDMRNIALEAITVEK